MDYGDNENSLKFILTCLWLFIGIIVSRCFCIKAQDDNEEDNNLLTRENYCNYTRYDFHVDV